MNAVIPIRLRQVALDHTEAEQAFLREPETLTDWISAKCMSVARVAEQARIEDVTAEDFATKSVGWLVALAFDAGQPHSTRTAALDAIAGKFVAAHAPQILALEQEIAARRQAVEDEEREELQEARFE